jgi:hypothetical protein
MGVDHRGSHVVALDSLLEDLGAGLRGEPLVLGVGAEEMLWTEPMEREARLKISEVAQLRFGVERLGVGSSPSCLKKIRDG